DCGLVGHSLLQLPKQFRGNASLLLISRGIGVVENHHAFFGNARNNLRQDSCLPTTSERKQDQVVIVLNEAGNQLPKQGRSVLVKLRPIKQLDLFGLLIFLEEE